MRVLWLLTLLCGGCGFGFRDDVAIGVPDTGFPRRDTARFTDDEPQDSGCPQPLSASCYVQDGVCYDERTVLSVEPLDADAITAVRAAHEAGSCEPEVVLACTTTDGSVIAHASRRTRGAGVDVFQDGSRVWVAGWLPADGQEQVCSDLWWVGDLRWRACADDALTRLTELQATCSDTDTPCACLDDAL